MQSMKPANVKVYIGVSVAEYEGLYANAEEDIILWKKWAMIDQRN